MADLNEGLDKAVEKFKELNSEADKLKGTVGDIADSAGSIGGQSSTQVANKSSSSSSQNSGGGFGSSGYSSFGAGTNTGAPTSTPSMPERFKSADDRSRLDKALRAGAGAVKVSVGTALAMASFAPTTQEAILVNQLAERIRFYSGVGTTAQRGYDIQKQASNEGTAINPYDAAYAGNFLAGNGLMPGLKNFRAGNNYTGILGGAALASNLAPGIGITGGAQAMSGINTAYNVNMLRMFGVQVRNSTGSGMNDLSSIIDRIYEILSRGGSVSEEDISISAMSGNALDSIINQYFGGDPQIRQVIIAGLIQKSKGQSFSKKALLSTGGLTKGAETTSNRSTSELQMIQNLSDPVIEGLTRTNNVLQKGYEYITKAGNTKAGRIGLQLTTSMETIAGARNNAGALLADAISGGNSGVALGLFGGAALIKSAYEGKNLDDEKVRATGIGITGQTQASPAGPLYTGAITINVSAPLSADPYAFASAITQAMTART
jgi:hypothetical protein